MIDLGDVSSIALIGTPVFLFAMFAWHKARVPQARGALLAVIAAWVLLILLPWGIALGLSEQSGWTFLFLGFVERDLPNSRLLHLVAGLALVAGAVVGPAVPRRVTPRSGSAGPTSAAPFLFVASAALALYALLIPARSGITEYLGVLLLCSFLALVWRGRIAALELGRRPIPSWYELVAFAALGSFFFNEFTRFRFAILTGGYLWLCLSAAWFAASSRAGRVLSVVVALGFLPVAAYSMAYQSALRSGGTVGANWIQDRLRYEVDTVSTTELALDRWSGDSLGGLSYRELPDYLNPMRLFTDRDVVASADVVFDNLLEPTSGFSGPLWVEGYLNFGLLGVALVGLLVGIVTKLVFRAAYRPRLTREAMTLGWGLVVLVDYQLLSRLLASQALLTLASALIGMLLAVAWRTKTRRGPARVSRSDRLQRGTVGRPSIKQAERGFGWGPPGG